MVGLHYTKRAAIVMPVPRAAKKHRAVKKHTCSEVRYVIKMVQLALDSCTENHVMYWTDGSVDHLHVKCIMTYQMERHGHVVQNSNSITLKPPSSKIAAPIRSCSNSNIIAPNQVSGLRP